MKHGIFPEDVCDDFHRSSMFICHSQPAVVHFMTQAYRRAYTDPTTTSRVLDHFISFWRAYDNLDEGWVHSAVQKAVGKSKV